MAKLDRIFSLCDATTRLRVRLRILTIPGAALNKYLPREGTFLDLGGGHGALAWYLHLHHPGRIFTVIDFDEKKISQGEAAARSADRKGVSYRHQDLRLLSSTDCSGFSQVLLADVLYLLTDRERADLFREIRQGLAITRGTLWIKDVAGGSGWKSLWDKAQEMVIQTIGWTKTTGISQTVPPTKLLKELKLAGFRAESFRIDHGYPHAHILYRALPE